jgi:hypothetical protein
MTNAPVFNTAQSIDTVLNILGKARIEPPGTSSSLQVKESAMPKVIRALHKSGFHRTTSLLDEVRYLTLRRMKILVELQLPELMFGSDESVKRRRHQAELRIESAVLSAEQVVESVRQDAQNDVSYESMLEIYKAKQESNAWRNTMQFVLPKEPQVTEIIALLDRCLEIHESGSAMDPNYFDIRWGGRGHTRRARMLFVPSNCRFEINLNVDKFSWHFVGQNFCYQDAASALQRDVESFLAENGDESAHRWLSRFHDTMTVHLQCAS